MTVQKGGETLVAAVYLEYNYNQGLLTVLSILLVEENGIVKEIFRAQAGMLLAHPATQENKTSIKETF